MVNSSSCCDGNFLAPGRVQSRPVLDIDENDRGVCASAEDIVGFTAQFENQLRSNFATNSGIANCQGLGSDAEHLRHTSLCGV